ncbi:MAG: Wzz/FepE/Etk N-terminal domain-containing protein [Candidatus Sulfotelmatobacter sp.]
MTEPNPESVSVKKSDPTLRDLLAPLFRRKRAFAKTFCGVMLGAVLAAFVLNSTHKATMEILVNDQRSDPTVTALSTQGQGSPPPVGDSAIGSEIELLKSPDLLEGVVIANRLQDNERKSFTHYLHPGADEAWYVARAVQRLGGKLDTQQVTKTSMIDVDYKSSNPQLAYHVLETLGRLYLEKHNAVRRPPGSYTFFASEADKYQKALADSESRLADFSKNTGIASPDVQRTDLAQHVADAVAALESTHQVIAADKRKLEDVTSRMKVIPERSLAQQSTDSAQGLMQQLQASLLAAELKKTQLLLKYEPSYPLVQEADQEIAETKAAIVSATKEQYVNQTTDRDPTFELMREDIAKTQADLAFQQATAGGLENSIHNLQMQMVDLDQKALEQADLTREVKANEANYLLYLSKREQERTSDALDERRIANVSIAVPPVLPILPLVSPLLVLFCGIVLAAFIGAGSAFLAEYLNPSLRTPAEVLEVLRIPVLASVPKQTA